MAPYLHHIFVCTGRKNAKKKCAKKGQAFLEALKNELKRQGTTAQIAVSSCECLDLCGRGPNAVVYPEGIWLTGVRPDDAPTLVSALISGEPLQSGFDIAEATIRSERSLSQARQNKMKQVRAAAGLLPLELEARFRGFEESRLLLSAIDLDIFNLVGDGATAEQVSAKARCEKRKVAVLLDALVGLGFLERNADRFSCAQEIDALRTAPSSSVKALAHWSHQYRAWADLTAAMRRSDPQAFHECDEKSERLEAFIAAMDLIGTVRSSAVFSGIGEMEALHVLDLGGGSGAYALAAARQWPAARVTILELPNVAPITERYVKQSGLGDRVRTIAADLHRTDLPGDFDLILASAVCHTASADQNRVLLAKCRKALVPNGVIAIHDFIPRRDQSMPLETALFGLEMFVSTDWGDVYELEQYEEWLKNAGFDEIRFVDLPGPTDLVLGKARV